MNQLERARSILARARALGFDQCGIAPAAEFEDLSRLPEWLERGFAGDMHYLEDPRRRSPARVVDGARSVIVCALNYNTARPYSTELPVGAATNENGKASPAPADDGAPRGWVSRYAWGDDYHAILGDKLEKLLEAMRSDFGQAFDARAYVDTGPVVERVAAKHAGLGWLGKNTCLIHPTLGSWLFLGVIVTTLDLAPSVAPHEAPPPDLCGNCTLCIDACPTQALVEPYVLDARRCISYLTIEHRGVISEELRGPMGRHVFGCDICQDVCPWNRNAPVSALEGFLPRNADGNRLFAPRLEWLASLGEQEFRAHFHSSAVKRTKWQGLVRNACIALGNSAAGLPPAARKRVAALLEKLSGSGNPLIAQHAQWALKRLVVETSQSSRPS